MSLKRIFFGILSLAIIGYLFLHFYSYSIIGEEITIRTNYMMYSCGEDCLQHKVKEVIKPYGKYEFLLDMDLSIKYASKEQEEAINKLAERCIICYEFYFSGKLEYSKMKGYIFNVKSANVELRDQDCCE